MENDKLAFGHCFESELFAEEKVSAGKVVLYKKFDERRNDFEGPYEEYKTLRSFLNEKSFAQVMEFDDRAIQKVFQEGNPTIFLFHDNKSEDSIKAIEVFSKVAKKYIHNDKKILFSVSHTLDGHGHF